MKWKPLWTAAALALIMAAPASADVWQGVTVASDITEITAEAGGALTALELIPGQHVSAGDCVGETSMTRVFAPLDGTVAAMHAELGDSVNGTVVEIAPVSLYTVVCSVSGARQDTVNTFVHSGETVYIRCTADGSHQAVGRITTIDGMEYDVEVLGGSLYVGETVRLFRDRSYSEEARIGVGTVLESDTLEIAGSGRLQTVNVGLGDKVERGQLLFSTAAEAETRLLVPADGVVTEILVSRGDTVKEDQVIARVSGSVILSLEAPADDSDYFRVGSRMTYVRGDAPHEAPHACTVIRVLHAVGGGNITVELRPEEKNLPIGMTVEIDNGM